MNCQMNKQTKQNKKRRRRCCIQEQISQTVQTEMNYKLSVSVIKVMAEMVGKSQCASVGCRAKKEETPCLPYVEAEADDGPTE